MTADRWPLIFGGQSGLGAVFKPALIVWQHQFYF